MRLVREGGRGRGQRCRRWSGRRDQSAGILRVTRQGSGGAYRTRGEELQAGGTECGRPRSRARAESLRNSEEIAARSRMSGEEGRRCRAEGQADRP